jgi:hypothetical protein
MQDRIKEIMVKMFSWEKTYKVISDKIPDVVLKKAAVKC